MENAERSVHNISAPKYIYPLNYVHHGFFFFLFFSLFFDQILSTCFAHKPLAIGAELERARRVGSVGASW